MFTAKGNALEYRREGETLRIEPWGSDALRVRAVMGREFSGRDWALLPPEAAQSTVRIDEQSASVICGGLTARIDAGGRLTFFNAEGEVLLQEAWRRSIDTPSLALKIPGREWKSRGGGRYRLTVRFYSQEEKLFGMGQYQMSYLNLKGCMLELAQRNSQASVPFLLSSRGYGFLWNNPAVGKAAFGVNGTEWTADSTRELDYWICTGDTPAAIEEQYAAATGKAPMMPEYAMGFWQSKLRYRTQEELLEVARRYAELGLPPGVLVIDFFHWPHQGDFRFDEKDWPDPEGMCAALRKMGIEPMVSVWPTVSPRSERYAEMAERGLLARVRQGAPVMMDFGGPTCFIDVTNPETREYVWKALKEGYRDKGIRLFWLDEAEPEFMTYDFDLYEYILGPVEEVGNIYPQLYARMVCDGLQEEGEKQPLSLVRCAWAGSQRYGALVWSGDIDSSWDSLNRQLRAGLNMAIAGIPWWTTDIGGFHGAKGEDPAFRLLLVRWLEYGCFCPVFRLHGQREPLEGFQGDTVGTGGPNEIWSFGPEIFALFQKYIRLRLLLRSYIMEQMRLAHEKGTPVMRPLFYDFPEDPAAWEVDDAYMFGHDLLVAPVLEDNVVSRKVYLPAGSVWTDLWSGGRTDGGRTIEVQAPTEIIPVFYRGENPPEAIAAAFSSEVE